MECPECENIMNLNFEQFKGRSPILCKCGWKQEYDIEVMVENKQIKVHW
jgi:hypothetical protein